MSRPLALAIAAMLLSAAAAGAAPREPRVTIFPPDVARSVGWRPFAPGEPPLWRPGDRHGYKRRLRLSIAGVALLSAVIRIDERADGTATASAVLVQRGPRARQPSRHTVPVSPAAMRRLDGDIAAAGLWASSPQHWTATDPNVVCLDGEQIVFERADAAGYGFAEANAQCTAPPALLAVARTMVALAGAGRAAALLR